MSALEEEDDFDFDLEEEAESPYRSVRVLVVGTNKAGDRLSQLNFAESDAQRVAKLLRERYRFHVVELIGEKATAAAIRSALVDLSLNANDDEDIIFYFSGHGGTIDFPEQKTKRAGILYPYDAAPTDAAPFLQKERSIEIPWVINALKQSQGRHRVAILDSCFSGIRIPSSEDFSPKLQGNHNELFEQPSVQLISAGTGSQLAIELPQVGGGLLSVELIRELENRGIKTFTKLFMDVHESVILQGNYLDALDGKPGEPQLRSFLEKQGAFAFVVPGSYKTWSKSKQTGLGVDSEPISEPMSQLYSGDVSKEEMEAAIESVASNEDAGEGGSKPLPDEEIDRYRARASMGDPEAQAILSALYSKSDDEQDQRAAADYAFSAYENSETVGAFALGSIFSQGIGVEKDTDLGDQLIKDSGLERLANLFESYNQVSQSIDALAEADTPEGKMQVASTVLNSVKETTQGLTKLFARDTVKRITRNLNDAQRNLGRKNSKKALSKLNTALQALLADAQIDPSSKAILVSGLEDSLAKLKADDLDAAHEAISDLLERIPQLGDNNSQQDESK